MSPEDLEALLRSLPPESTAAVSRQAVAKTSVAVDDLALSLIMLEGRQAGRRIKVSERPKTVGRDHHVDVVLADSDVSRLHCLLSVVDGSVIVEDLGSMNGTFIDDQRIDRRAPVPIGALLRIGEHVFRCEQCRRRDVDRAEEQHRDLDRAANYVLSLLPRPIATGPVRTEWIFLPSARLGGDAFGYEALDAHAFAIYLIDVCGHGVSAAMHSVSVLNVLRQHALPATDFKDPVQVLSALNVMFQMDRHDDQYFTMWYGVYDTRERTLTHASAGHHPGYLVPEERSDAQPLKTPGVMMGAMLDARFHAERTRVPAGSSLYLFSDGVFEVLTAERQWHLSDFVPYLLQPVTRGTSECRRLHQAVKAVCRSDSLEDDFSLLVVTFP